MNRETFCAKYAPPIVLAPRVMLAMLVIVLALLPSVLLMSHWMPCAPVLSIRVLGVNRVGRRQGGWGPGVRWLIPLSCVT